MGMNDALIEGFAHDLWANLQWADTLAGFGMHRDAAEKVLWHVHRAQLSWLERCRGDESPEPPTELRAALEASTAQWQEFLAISDPGAFVSYTTRTGESHFNTVEQIARHVLNHGTYHRGQLRGLAMAEGFEDTPETDLIVYYRRK